MSFVIATLTVKPEAKAELPTASKDAIAATRRETGSVSRELFESTVDPSKLTFIEEWELPDCLPLHSKSDHMRAFGRVAVKCFAAPVQVQIITPEQVENREPRPQCDRPLKERL
ncbi:putative quinol monooxygenase [Bradyrhizobium sp.]|jgi:quinol monooxygenase YgiN|uniref:putative quinol monooxygenase n=1 Tax=Bradyrhizobium sp. TaxID=376 RepID=UPI002DDD4DA5|nr:antibiotic biosynthesis monooxygenase [Bradyrhizobium sp.]HEV2160542.1 antibiotic biosynthesis monooxygenase [Bradyrhizobium sp.]